MHFDFRNDERIEIRSEEEYNRCFDDIQSTFQLFVTPKKDHWATYKKLVPPIIILFLACFILLSTNGPRYLEEHTCEPSQPPETCAPCEQCEPCETCQPAETCAPCEQCEPCQPPETCAPCEQCEPSEMCKACYCEELSVDQND